MPGRDLICSPLSCRGLAPVTRRTPRPRRQAGRRPSLRPSRRPGRLLGLVVAIGCVAIASTAAAADDPCAAGEEAWRSGHRTEALPLLTECLANHPDDEGLRLRLAERLLEVHRAEATLEVLTPLGKPADELRGRALYILGRYAEAVDVLDEEHLLSAIMLIDALEASGRLDEADAAADRASGRFGDVHVRLIAWRGRRAARDGDHAAAETWFRKALAVDPTDLESIFGLGQALVRSGRREEGLAELQRHRELVPLMDAYDYALRAVDLNPSHPASLAQLADTERALGKLDDALAHYRLAARFATPEALPPIILRLARFLVEEQADVDGAVAVLDEAAQASNDARLPVRAGDILMDAARPEQAAKRYERARQLRPDDAQIATRLARAHTALGLRAVDG